MCKFLSPQKDMLELLAYSLIRVIFDISNDLSRPTEMKDYLFFVSAFTFLLATMVKISIVYSIAFGIHRDFIAVKNLFKYVLKYSWIYVLPPIINFIFIIILGKEWYLDHIKYRFDFLPSYLYFPPAEFFMVAVIFLLSRKFCRESGIKFSPVKSAVAIVFLAFDIILEGYYLLPILGIKADIAKHYLWSLINISSAFVFILIFSVAYHKELLKAFRFPQMLFFAVLPFLAEADVKALMLSISGALVWQASVMMNDVKDLEIDKRIHRDRPLVLGLFTKKGYKKIALTLYITAVLLSFMNGTYPAENVEIHWDVFLITLIAVFLSVLYNHANFILRQVIIGFAVFLLLYREPSFGFIVALSVAVGSMFKDYRDAEGDRGLRETLFTKYENAKNIYLKLVAVASVISIIISVIKGWLLLALAYAFMPLIIYKLMLLENRKTAYKILILIYMLVLISSQLVAL